MNIRGRGIRRALGAPLSALLVCLSVSVPLLERTDLADRTVIEHEHDPASCPTGHDHTVCAQAGANLPVPTAVPSHGPAPALAHAPKEERESAASPRAFAEGPPSRAPPTS